VRTWHAPLDKVPRRPPQPVAVRRALRGDHREDPLAPHQGERPGKPVPAICSLQTGPPQPGRDQHRGQPPQERPDHRVGAAVGRPKARSRWIWAEFTAATACSYASSIGVSTASRSAESRRPRVRRTWSPAASVGGAASPSRGHTPAEARLTVCDSWAWNRPADVLADRSDVPRGYPPLRTGHDDERRAWARSALGREASCDPTAGAMEPVIRAPSNGCPAPLHNVNRAAEGTRETVRNL
jgi:hypothetical protein